MARAAAVGVAWGLLLHRLDVVSAPAGDSVGTSAPAAQALAYFHGIASFPRVLVSPGLPGVAAAVPLQTHQHQICSLVSWPVHTYL